MSRDTTRSCSFPSKNYYTLSLISPLQIIQVHTQFVMTDPLSGNDRRRSTVKWDRNNCTHTTKAAQVKRDSNITNTGCGRKNTPIWEGHSFGWRARTVVRSASSNSGVRAVFSVYHGVVGRTSSLYC